jgi:hypothetical protein
VWEYLSDLNEQKLQNLLKALDGWEIHVILNYRRLYEWLPSWYVYSQKSALVIAAKSLQLSDRCFNFENLQVFSKAPTSSWPRTIFRLAWTVDGIGRQNSAPDRRAAIPV